MSPADNFYGDDPFNPATQDKDNETKHMSEVLRKAIDAMLYEARIAIPATITKVRGNSLVDVQINLQKRYIVDGLVTIPPIQGVPFMHPRGTGYWIKLPIAVGDCGHLIINDRSLDAWKVQGGTVDPNDPRRNALSDAVFYPGLYPNNAQLPGNPTDMILHNQQAEIYLQAGGKFKVTNGQNELFDILANALVLTGIGPQPFIAATVTQINSLKGS